MPTRRFESSFPPAAVGWVFSKYLISQSPNTQLLGQETSLLEKSSVFCIVLRLENGAGVQINPIENVPLRGNSGHKICIFPELPELILEKPRKESHLNFSESACLKWNCRKQIDLKVKSFLGGWGGD